MTEKAYFIDEARDIYAQTKKRLLENKEDDIIYYMISHLIRSGMPKEDIFPLLQEMAILCDPMAMEQSTKDKIDRAIDICLNDKKHFNLAEEVRQFVVSTNGHFLSTDVHRELGVSTRVHKKNVSEILRRLINDGLIERYGNKNGCFRLIDKNLEKIEWGKDPGKELDISLPFNLNELVKIYPKNIIIVAGMSNAGKTAFLLNIAGLNLDRYKGRINYFSSEMGACELKTRLLKFGLPNECWDNCNFYERSSDFSDVINPNYINFVDYLEINDSFWMIGEKLASIANKLDKGIAVIALQKDGSKKEGRGASFSVEKPRLYLTIDDIGDHNEIKILKAKNWKTGVNPNNLVKSFKIIDGYKLIELNNWGKKTNE